MKIQFTTGFLERYGHPDYTNTHILELDTTVALEQYLRSHEGIIVNREDPTVPQLIATCECDYIIVTTPNIDTISAIQKQIELKGKRCIFIWENDNIPWCDSIMNPSESTNVVVFFLVGGDDINPISTKTRTEILAAYEEQRSHEIDPSRMQYFDFNSHYSWRQIVANFIAQLYETPENPVTQKVAQLSS